VNHLRLLKSRLNPPAANAAPVAAHIPPSASADDNRTRAAASPGASASRPASQLVGDVAPARPATLRPTTSCTAPSPTAESRRAERSTRCTTATMSSSSERDHMFAASAASSPCSIRASAASSGCSGACPSLIDIPDTLETTTDRNGSVEPQNAPFPDTKR
jgi:hypothetical protein